ncbi:centromere protein O isoform X2 [Oryzias latipes]|uniref:centromere protein O isoform X2 n=1 Tax=Oryzias latipes TaxID=8090 RepID=UPI000CE281CB|nr:centromere protein O isoform X2 [Oryzias latipes]
MENVSTNGVLTHLSQLEVRARSPGGPETQRSRVKELRAEAEELRGLREQLKAEIRALKHLQELRSSADPRPSEDPPLLQMMCRQLDLKDLLHGHHLIGGLDAVQTRQGRAVCVSLQTTYEGVFLETFNLELELKPRVRIGRHNIPPFVPLQSLAEQSRLQTDPGAFLSTLSQHLNAFVGRRRQLQLVKEQHASVEVMESNLPCSILVLLFTAQTEKAAVLCTLEYSDHGSRLPGRVVLDCEDKQLLKSPEWRSCCATLMKTPVHRALARMKKSSLIL